MALTEDLAAFLDLATQWLALGTWVVWLLMGNGRSHAEVGDDVQDRGTRAWTTVVGLGSLFVAAGLAAVLPWGRISGAAWPMRAAGSALALLGIALREWAIWTLGRLFTQTVMIRAGHHVVTSGPYRVLRHPAYAGTLLTFAGLILALGNWLSLALVIVGFFAAHVPRIRVEERALEASLGEPYLELERTRKRLIPGVW